MKNIMEILELKHIQQYPLGKNGLQVIRDCSGRITTETITGLCEDGVYFKNGYCVFKNIKPIVRRLSDLTKEIEYKGEKFVMMKIIRQKALDEHFIAKEQWSMLHFLLTDNSTFKKNLPFWVIELLVKYHFWIFDQSYFDERIIIDINSLKVK